MRLVLQRYAGPDSGEDRKEMTDVSNNPELLDV